MPWRLPCMTCKSNNLKKSIPDGYTATTERCCTHQVPVMKCSVSMPPDSNTSIHVVQ
jgi:hypothetical protein